MPLLTGGHGTAYILSSAAHQNKPTQHSCNTCRVTTTKVLFFGVWLITNVCFFSF